MRRQHAAGALSVVCSSGVDLLTQMPLTSELLKAVVPSFSLSMIRVDETCAPREHYSEHFDEFSHTLFASAGHVFSARTDDPAAFGNLLRQADPVGSLIDGRQAFLEGATYQHLFKRNGIHHVLDVALRDARGPLGILGIFREQDGKPFTEADVARVRALYPQLVHALAAPRGHGRFDEVDGALVIATRSGHLEWVSPNAQRWLEDAIGGPERAALMKQRQLPEACRALFQQLDGLARPRRSSSAAAPTLTLPLAGGRLRLRAYRMGQLDGGGERFGVQLSLELNRTLRVAAALEKTKLPTQLQRVALRLWQGASPAAITTELDVTAETFKSYRKELYMRLDVHGVDGLREHLDALASAVTLNFDRHLPREG